MRDLFIGECLRFRNAALIFFAAHLALQLFLSRITDVLQMAWEKQVVALALYLLSGLGFALYQFGSYRQPGRWVWLLHRPLSRGAIFGAVALASTALILFAVGLPALLTVLAEQRFGAAPVDLRHYLLVLHVVLLTLIAWLAGALVAINRSRSAIVILVLPYLMLGHAGSGFAMLLPALLCAALLAFITYCAFKPDRLAPPDTGAALFATALPLLFGFYLALLAAGSMTFQYGQMAAGVHPLNSAQPPAGGFTELTRSDGRAAFRSGLAASADPRAPHWRRQVALLDVIDIEPEVRRYALRHQVANMGQHTFSDIANKVEWRFSDDSMLFHGSDLYTGAARGWIGAGGLGDKTPFSAAPALAAKGFMTPHHYYAFDTSTQKMRQLLAVEAPETLAGAALEAGDRLYVLTNHRLIAYDRQATEGLLAPLFSVPLPGPFNDLDRVDIATLLDGTLLSFNAGRHLNLGEPGGAQTVMFVDTAGRAQVVAQRAVAHDFPVLFEHNDWWLSPVLHAVVALPDVLIDKGIVLDRGLATYSNPLQRPRPWQAKVAALACALLSAVAAWWWLRPVAAGRRRKAGWIAAAFLLGPPAIPCLVLLQPRPPRLAAVPCVLAATA
ncbi:MAG: hypothetical protein ABWY27_15835 [Telluria sp.]